MLLFVYDFTWNILLLDAYTFLFILFKLNILIPVVHLGIRFQMLSMRNGLNSHPLYLPGALQPLQASQLCMSFGDNASAMNLGVLGMLPPNQDSSANNSFDLTSQCTTSHQTVMLPTVNISAPETSFGLEPTQSHHASFQLGVPSEVMISVTK